MPNPNRIILSLVRHEDGGENYPSVCVSIHEDVDIHGLFNAFEAFALGVGYGHHSFVNGLRAALENLTDAPRRPGDR